MISKEALIKRFVSYVTIDTQSDPKSNTTPSTSKQWDLVRLLKKEVEEMGLVNISLDENGYLMAKLPASKGVEAPVIGFVSHYDTTPDFSGTGVKPQIIEKYEGGKITLDTEGKFILDPEDFPEIKNYKGQTIITTDGSTLLGADDKAGITEIMEAVKYLKQHPEIKHGELRICFTPDEEIGRGAHKFDVAAFAADWAYTMDGSTIGELEYENFNAASAVVTVAGKSVHPGYAKGKMINSVLVAQDFINSLPRMETPEHTEDREGFFHLHTIAGHVEETTLEYIIRDHDSKHFDARKDFLHRLAEEINTQYEKELITIEIKDQYFNMREKIEPVMHIVDLAESAMKAVGVTPLIKPIRGGTDGSQLSFMGLPCPNIFAGGHNFHGRYEYIPVESMQKAVAVIVKIAELAAAKN
ncbi:MAG: peptidase T [Leeuwenhoekiella sp.]